MTILLAKACPEGLLLAGDLGVTSGSRQRVCKNKWTQVGPWYIGVAGTASIKHVISMGTTGQAPPDIKGLISWLMGHFAGHGVRPVEAQGVMSYECDMIVARGRSIWELDCCLAYREIDEGSWAAVGSGEPIARGALDVISLLDPPWSNEQVAREVIQIAANNIAGITGCRVDIKPYGSEAPAQRLKVMSVAER